MSIAHTGGDWRRSRPFEPGKYPLTSVISIAAGAAVIAHVNTAWGNGDANAALIEASPDMLDALIMVRDADEDCKKHGLPTIPPAARAKIDAAIARAEGRS